MSYYIFSDVSLDIDKEFSEKNDIRYIPMDYVLGEEEFHCTAPEDDIMMHNFYDKLRQKITTHTSQITPSHYIEVFTPFVENKEEILYLSLSSGLSNTYDSALMAVNMLKDEYEDVKIEVVDSLGATGGIGLLIESAVKNRNDGMSLEENADWLRKHAVNVNYWFKVEDLMYLKRGGRVSATTALVGTALNIKPILTVNKDGRLESIDKKRGSKLAYKSMIERFEKNFDKSLGNIIYICCADCMEDAKLVKESIMENHPDIVVRTTMLSPIIGAHTGPDMLALIYYGQEREF